MNTPTLAGKAVLVTGAGRGLGRATAIALAHAGAWVVLVARTRAQLDETAAAVRAVGAEALVLPADVVEAGSAARAVEAAVGAFGRLDALVYAAGVSVTRPSLEVTEDEWDRVVDTNLKAAFFWSQAAARVMVPARRGAIVYIGSVTGQRGMPWLAPYSASKAGLEGLTRCLAAEWGASGIRVNTVAAGFVKTELTQAELSDERLVRRIVQRAPLGRLGEPEDVAAAVAFLLGESSAYMTGHVLALDGGWLAG